MGTYIPILIALVSSLIGVFGDTWVKNKADEKKLSTKGKAVLIIAVLSFTFSIIQKINDEEKITQLEDAKKKLNILAQKKLQEALKECINPIFQMGKPTASLDTIIAYDKLSNMAKLDTVNKIEFWKRIKRKNLFTSISTVKSWGTYINERHSQSKMMFEEVLGKHGAYLKIETISRINEILEDEVFKSLLHRTGNMRNMNIIWRNNLEFYIAIGIKDVDSY